MVRAYRLGDEAKVAELLGPETARPGQRVHVASDRTGDVAIATWTGERGGDGMLGAVETKDPTRRDAFYAVIRTVALAMLDEGFTRGTFTVKDKRLLDLIDRDFRVAPEAAGWDPTTGYEIEWRVDVDLADAVAQLDAAIARLARSP